MDRATFALKQTKHRVDSCPVFIGQRKLFNDGALRTQLLDGTFHGLLLFSRDAIIVGCAQPRQARRSLRLDARIGLHWHGGQHNAIGLSRGSIAQHIKRIRDVVD